MQVDRCRNCGTTAYPQRFACPRCSSQSFERLDVEHGVVEERTIVLRAAGGEVRPLTLASVRLDGGAILVVRLEEPVDSGSVVAITPLAEAQGAVTATPP